MKNAQNGFALIEFTTALPVLLSLRMDSHALGMLMIGLSLTALLFDYRAKVESAKIKVR